MIDMVLVKKLDLKHPAVWLATWGGCGFIKPAPGTWGTLGGLPFGVLMLYYGGWAQLLCASLIVFYFGWQACRRFEEMTKEHDSGAIVIDEVVGIWVALFAAPLSIPGVILAFLLFRLFDIKKPWPVSLFDKMPGATGVMLDDIAAGVYAALCLWGLQHAGLI